MRHFLTIIGLLLLLCCPAQGESILGNLLTADGNVDSMNDNSRSLILDAQQEGQPGYNVLSEGDQVVGILQLERINHVDPSPSGVFAIFAFELADTYVYDNDTFYQCRPIQSGDTNSLRSLLDDDLEPAGFSNWDSALFAFLEIDELGVNDPKDPFSQLNTGAAVNPFDVMTNVLAQSNGYRVDMITGFGNQSDFLTLRELVSFALVSDIQNDDSGVQIFSERAGMSILYDIFGYSYLPLALNNAPFGTANTSHDILLNPDGAIQTSDEIVPNWHFEDDANFKVHPIPEPGIATLAISLLVATGLSRPRRRR